MIKDESSTEKSFAVTLSRSPLAGFINDAVRKHITIIISHQVSHISSNNRNESEGKTATETVELS